MTTEITLTGSPAFIMGLAAANAEIERLKAQVERLSVYETEAELADIIRRMEQERDEALAEIERLRVEVAQLRTEREAILYSLHRHGFTLSDDHGVVICLRTGDEHTCGTGLRD